MTSQPLAPYIRYLAAKQSVDDRALNRGVYQALAQALGPRREAGALAFLELGCGLGTMVERLWDWGLFARADYTGVDQSPEHIAAARARLMAFARHQGAEVLETRENGLLFAGPGLALRVTLKAGDMFDFAAREGGRAAWDVLMAHAFLDLVDLRTALPRLFGLLKPGGWFYFTLNFDGATIFLPPLEPTLDARIENLYHASMDGRRVDGRPSGSSRTGRLLFDLLPCCGGRLLAAGSSDWVVFPGPHGYPGDEAFFLRHIIDTVEGAVRGQAGLEEKALNEWTRQRRRQIDRGELTYIAHQLDFFGIKEG
jgi:SAM-dependent methyltransferase